MEHATAEVRVERVEPGDTVAHKGIWLVIHETATLIDPDRGTVVRLSGWPDHRVGRGRRVVAEYGKGDVVIVQATPAEQDRILLAIGVALDAAISEERARDDDQYGEGQARAVFEPSVQLDHGQLLVRAAGRTWAVPLPLARPEAVSPTEEVDGDDG